MKTQYKSVTFRENSLKRIGLCNEIIDLKKGARNRRQNKYCTKEMEMTKVIELDEKCKECHGTGLYVGMGERDGFAVVCYNCKGTGCHHFRYEYEDFTNRIIRDGIARILQTNPGICVGLGENNQYGYSDFGGMPYKDWLDGKPFTPGMEMRRFTCPAWWYQTADYKKKPTWCECMLGRSFCNCPSFNNKETCWERWDKENTKTVV